MNTSDIWIKAGIGIGLVGIAVLLVILFNVAFAGDDSKDEGTGYSDDRPWFDGLDHPYFLDMFNQPSIKPQEEGSFQTFPANSVPRRGAEPFIDAVAMVEGQLQRDLVPTNPTNTTPDSVARGRVLYEIYCAVCHGKDGMAGTPVTKKGMPAPPVKMLIPIYSEAHLYNKIRYGGPIMPAYGFQTSRADRWDMVNYMKSPHFGQGTTQQ